MQFRDIFSQNGRQSCLLNPFVFNVYEIKYFLSHSKIKIPQHSGYYYDSLISTLTLLFLVSVVNVSIVRYGID